MTLFEMSAQYEASAAAIRLRIAQLQQARREAPDEATARAFSRRIAELDPILREMRALATRTAHYYDRRKG